MVRLNLRLLCIAAAFARAEATDLPATEQALSCHEPACDGADGVCSCTDVFAACAERNDCCSDTLARCSPAIEEQRRLAPSNETEALASNETSANKTKHAHEHTGKASNSSAHTPKEEKGKKAQPSEGKSDGKSAGTKKPDAEKKESKPPGDSKKEPKKDDKKDTDKKDAKTEKKDDKKGSEKKQSSPKTASIPERVATLFGLGHKELLKLEVIAACVLALLIPIACALVLVCRSRGWCCFRQYQKVGGSEDPPPDGEVQIP